jgi:hypothetical protein
VDLVSLTKNKGIHRHTDLINLISQKKIGEGDTQTDEQTQTGEQGDLISLPLFFFQNKESRKMA